MLTQEYLARLLEDRDGVLYWRVSRTNRIRVGDVAGYRKANGRSVVRIDNRLHFAHRVIFLLHHGWMPTEIDHIDGDVTNNRIANLRPVSRQQNQFNSRLRSDSSSGIKGVSWYAQTSKWRVQIRKDRRKVHIGYYADIAEAAAASRAAQQAVHGEYARN